MPMLRVSLACFLLLGSCTTVGIPVPRGAAVELDGTLSEDEWAEARHLPLVNDGTVRLQHDAESVYVGFQGPPDGWVHIYLTSADSVHVLHASAALGRATYMRQRDLWTPVRGFTWEVRGQDLTDTLRAKRRAFLDREGWAASTMAMGTPGEIEVQISRVWAESSSAIAFVYATGPEVILYSPASLSDATIAPSLVRGDTPDSLRFTPDQWLRLDLR